jgi:hypothetical protein
VLPEMGPDLAAYDRRLAEQSGVCQRFKSELIFGVRFKLARWTLRFRPEKRLALLVSDLTRGEAAKASSEPGLIERLEMRLAGMKDVQVREELLKCLSEP